jgi:hypothetical protein
MHIVEKDEKLSWPDFWAHGHGIAEWGPMYWQLIEGGADTFPCSTCKPGAQAIAHGGHDLVNILKGRKVQTPEHLEMLFYMTEYAKRRYKGKHCVGGNCGPKVKHIG